MTEGLDAVESVWAQSIPLKAGSLDLGSGEFTRGETVVRLTMTETMLLRVLVANQGEPVSRETLHAEVWGYSPRVRSRAADQAVKRLRKKLESDPGNPDHLRTAHGSGYRMVVKPIQDASPSGGAGRHCPSNLPKMPPLLLGRDQMLGQLDDWVEQGSGLASILGPAGMGKTTLARAWACAQLEGPRFVEGGVWFSDVSGLSIGAMMMAKVARDMRLQVSGTVSSEGIGHALAARGPTLLVIDNLASGPRGIGRVLEGWAQMAPQLRIVCTSQVRLDVASEHCIHLPPLPLDAASRLLAQRIGQVRSGEFDAEDIGALAAELEGIPLAIELAAGRCSLLSPAELRARSDNLLGVLVRTPTEKTARHGTMHAALLGAWEALAPNEQHLLEQCRVFSGGFDVAAAEQVLESIESDTTVLEGLQRLRDHSLVQIATVGGETRIYLLGLIQAFLESQPLSPAFADTVCRHAELYAQRVESCLGASDQAQWTDFERVVPDLENLRAAFERADQLGDEMAIRVRTAWSMAIFGRGLSDMSIQAAKAAYDHTQKAPDVAALHRVRAWRRHGKCLVETQALQSGVDVLEQAVALADAHGLHREVIFAQADLIFILFRYRRISDAQAHLDGARSRMEEHAPEQAPLIESLQARIHKHMGKLDAAEACALSARDGWLKTGHHAGAASALWSLGFIHLERQELAAARSCFQEAIEAFEVAGDPRAPSLHGLLGLVALERGDLAEAAEILESSAAWCAQKGSLHFLAEDCYMLGLVALRRGDPQAALMHLEAAIAHYAGVTDVSHLVEASVMTAVARAQLGDSARAHRELHTLVSDPRLEQVADGRRLIEVANKLVEVEAAADPSEFRPWLDEMVQAGRPVSLSLRIAVRLLEDKMAT